MTTIRVHRGTDCIGGSITEIYNDKSHIFIDFGSELAADPDNSTDADMIDMMNGSECDAVLFTHYHGDHIGLMDRIPATDVCGRKIRLYMGKIAASVLKNIHSYLLNVEDITEKERNDHRYHLEMLKDADRCIYIEDGKSFFPDEARQFKVTPVLVDHSAYDAYMFIIESVSDGKVIVHTGDFRTHGRLGKDLFERVEKALEGKKVDVLITEGTMMSRIGEKVMTEEELQIRANEYLKMSDNKYAFLICSSTNMESLASFANAAFDVIDNGEHRGFYVNSYVKLQTDLFARTAGNHGRNKEFGFWKTNRLERMNWVNPLLGMTQLEYMEKHGFLMLIGTSKGYMDRIKYFRDRGYDPLLIYAMWDGYVHKDKYPDTYRSDIGDFYNSWPKDRRLDLHTSGHATAEDIAEMILTVKPCNAILPIHTEKPEAFRNLDIGEYASLIPEGFAVSGTYTC